MSSHLSEFSEIVLSRLKANGKRGTVILDSLRCQGVTTRHYVQLIYNIIFSNI